MAESRVFTFLSSYSPEIQAVALKARRLVLELAPDAIEQVDLPARMIAYGFAPTYKDTICVIMPLKAGVNLGFPRGAGLPDPAGLLSGAGKRARHVRLSEPGDVDNPALHKLLELSIQQIRR
jgi:hypothetical protein